jgi:hypothetical protein
MRGACRGQRSRPVQPPFLDDTMTDRIPILEKHERGKWFFLAAFLFSCLLFWWLPSLLFRFAVHRVDPVEDGTILLSLLATAVFIAGYLLPARRRSSSFLSEELVDACQEFAYRATVLISIPAMLVAAQFWSSRSGVDYGAGEGISTLQQAVLYTHLFFGCMYLGAVDAEKQEGRRIRIAMVLIVLPRLIVSLHWGRFFLAQAVVPLIFIAVARGCIRFSPKRILQFSAVACALIFVPSLTRGDNLAGQQAMVEFFSQGSTLRLFQDNRDLNLDGRCPPLAVSMTAKLIPYSAIGVCTIDIWGMKNLPATLDRILSANVPGADVLLIGPGSNFLLELDLSGGIVVVLAGTAFFGFSCRRFVAWIGKRSLFSGIWAECLTRALLAPRSNLGYVYERIPTLVLTTLFVVFLVGAARLLQRECAAGPATGFAA